MKLIIAGSRSVPEACALAYIFAYMHDHPMDVREVVSGTARGPDRAGEEWAKKYRIPVKRFLPNWNRWGKRAGLVRNIEMGKYADGLLAIWDEKSHGTRQMVEWMLMYGKPVAVINSNDPLDGMNRLPERPA